MKKSLVMKDINNVEAFSKKARYKFKVSRYNEEAEKQSWTIAISFHELEETFYKLIEKFPQLLAKRKMLKKLMIYCLI